MEFDYFNLFNKVKNIIYEAQAKKLVIFGTGSFAKLLSEYMPKKPSYYVDNNINKLNRLFMDSDIHSPDLLKTEDSNNLLILVASMYYEEISQQLKSMGLNEGEHFENGRPLYDLINVYKSFGLEEDLKEYIRKEQLITSSCTDPHKVVLANKECEWLCADNDRLYLKGLLEGYMLVFVEDNRNTHNIYFEKMDKSFRQIEYKGINLYEVSIYNICVDLQLVITDIDISLNEHKDAIRKWYNISANYINTIENLTESLNVTSVMILQGYLYTSAILRRFALSNEMPILALENTFNKTKAIWDNISGITVNKNLARSYYWRYYDSVDFSTAFEYCMKYIDGIKNLKMEEHITPSNKFLQKSGRKTILYIGQVYSDSSVLFGIWNFKNPVEIINVLVDYCINNDFQLIVKPHPKEKDLVDVLGNKYDKLTFRMINKDKELAEKITKYGVVVDSENEYDTYSLIDYSDLCITINSQAGLEALIKNKDVILCGNCSYGGLGFSYEAHNKDMLLCFMDMVLKKGISLINKEDIYKFFYIFNEKYCISKDAEAIIDKLKTIEFGLNKKNAGRN
ncbi:MAG TPA: polysialyltransferase family glycosyltransferase [Bacillota bacterium]|nr:polysialyltransferase family glycosyltransferase [Bacillota bacterium]